LLSFVLFKSLCEVWFANYQDSILSNIRITRIYIRYGSGIVAPYISANDRSRDYKGPGNFDRVWKWT
jgi:hypothetical protein